MSSKFMRMDSNQEGHVDTTEHGVVSNSANERSSSQAIPGDNNDNITIFFTLSLSHIFYSL